MSRALAVNRTRGRETESELALIDNTDSDVVVIEIDDERIEFNRTELAAALVEREAA